MIILSMAVGFLIAVSLGKLKTEYSKQTTFNKGFECGVTHSANTFNGMRIKVQRASNKDGLYITAFLNNPPEGKL